MRDYDSNPTHSIFILKLFVLFILLADASSWSARTNLASKHSAFVAFVLFACCYEFLIGFGHKTEENLVELRHHSPRYLRGVLRVGIRDGSCCPVGARSTTT